MTLMTFMFAVIGVNAIGLLGMFAVKSKLRSLLSEKVANGDPPAPQKRADSVVPGDDCIDSAVRLPPWTDLDDHQLRRLLDDSPP